MIVMCKEHWSNHREFWKHLCSEIHYNAKIILTWCHDSTVNFSSNWSSEFNLHSVRKTEGKLSNEKFQAQFNAKIDRMSFIFQIDCHDIYFSCSRVQKQELGPASISTLFYSQFNGPIWRPPNQHEKMVERGKPKLLELESYRNCQFCTNDILKWSSLLIIQSSKKIFALIWLT